MAAQRLKVQVGGRQSNALGKRSKLTASWHTHTRTHAYMQKHHYTHIHAHKHRGREKRSCNCWAHTRMRKTLIINHAYACWHSKSYAPTIVLVCVPVWVTESQCVWVCVCVKTCPGSWPTALRCSFLARLERTLAARQLHERCLLCRQRIGRTKCARTTNQSAACAQRPWPNRIRRQLAQRCQDPAPNNILYIHIYNFIFILVFISQLF